MVHQDLDSHLERTAPARRRGLGRLAHDRRIWAAASILLALLVVGLFTAMFLVMRLGEDAEDFTQRQIQYSTALSNAAINAKGIANDERGYLLSGNREFLLEIDARTAVARESFDRAAQAADDPQTERILKAYEVFERWLVAVEDEIDMFQAGDREAARAASLGPTRDLRKEYEALLATAALTESGVPDATASVSAATSRAVAILFVYLIAAIIIGAAVNAWAVAGHGHTHP
jgi:methyl-accepting chemotaxis protein